MTRIHCARWRTNDSLGGTIALNCGGRDALRRSPRTIYEGPLIRMNGWARARTGRHGVTHVTEGSAEVRVIFPAAVGLESATERERDSWKRALEECETMSKIQSLMKSWHVDIGIKGKLNLCDRVDWRSSTSRGDDCEFLLFLLGKMSTVSGWKVNKWLLVYAINLIGNLIYSIEL